MTGAAQGVDASRVVFAFARDNALPGSRWWKRINRRTQTPVNAVWFVMVSAALCGLLGFSAAALSSLAGSVFLSSQLLLAHVGFPFAHRASVIGLYVSYATPIFLRVIAGQDALSPGYFTLGRWYKPIGIVAVSWVAFIVVLLMFPSSQTTTAQNMSAYPFARTRVPQLMCYTRLCRRNHYGCVFVRVAVMGGVCAQMVPWADQDRR